MLFRSVKENSTPRAHYFAAVGFGSGCRCSISPSMAGLTGRRLGWVLEPRPKRAVMWQTPILRRRAHKIARSQMPWQTPWQSAKLAYMSAPTTEARPPSDGQAIEQGPRREFQGRAVELEGGKAVRASRTRYLLPGNPNLSRSRRPPIPARLGIATAAILGPELGDLV